MNKKTEKRFHRALRYDWPLYLVLPVVAGFVISYLFSVVHEPAAYEKLNVFVASNSLESTAFCQDLKDKFSSSGLKKASTVQSNPSDAVFLQKLSVVGYGGSDLFLLPESVLAKCQPEDAFLPLSDSFKTSHVTETDPVYYLSDGVAFALRVKKKGEASWLSEYVGFLDEDYYLALNTMSKNLGDYGIYDNPSYDLAIKAFDYLEGTVK